MSYEEVSGDELNMAFVRWLRASPNQAYGSTSREFQKLVGVGSFIMDKYRVSPQQAAMIRNMAGPHGYAYCKAIIANLP